MLKQYRVTWAPFVVVTAENEDDAWAKFCDGNPEAQRQPKLYPKIIEEVVAETTPPEPSLAVHIVEPPVDQLPANEAIERIGRMTSRDRLNQIVSHDQRHDVSRAARKRLAELPTEPSST